MLVVMQENAPEADTEAVINRLVEMGFTVHRSTGVRHTLLGGVGPMDDFDPAVLEVMASVKECHRIVSPYKLASRHFRPDGTVVKIGKVEIGGSKVVSMAGPCSVESEEQIEESAALVAAAGAEIIRGGAFKPRSSPYSFQGMGEKGLGDSARRGPPAWSLSDQRSHGPGADPRVAQIFGHPSSRSA